MSRTIKDPSIGGYAIKQDFNRTVVLDKEEKIVYNCKKDGNEAITEAIMFIHKRIRLHDTDEVVTLKQFNDEQHRMKVAVDNSLKPEGETE
jgi:hypothetical protein